MTRFSKPLKYDLSAKHSSLAIRIYEDSEYGLSFYVYNRRTRSILHKYEVSLMEHSRLSLLDAEPIEFKRKKK